MKPCIEVAIKINKTLVPDMNYHGLASTKYSETPRTSPMTNRTCSDYIGPPHQTNWIDKTRQYQILSH